MKGLGLRTTYFVEQNDAALIHAEKTFYQHTTEADIIHQLIRELPKSLPQW